MEEFKNLKRVAMNDLRKLDSQYANKEEFSDTDAKMYDCLMHGLKCQLTAEAMLEAEGYEENNMKGVSGYRGRAMNGRYVSRNPGDSNGNNSYTEGYSDGYSEAMDRMGNTRGNSGHYPMGSYPPPRW